jgi:hypothetical protein
MLEQENLAVTSKPILILDAMEAGYHDILTHSNLPPIVTIDRKI